MGKVASGAFPYKTIGAYLDGGASAINTLMKIHGFGKTMALELQSLIQYALGGDLQSARTNTLHTKKLELADQLEEKYPGVFEPLISSYQQKISDNDLAHHLEKQIQQLIKKPRDAEICQRRFNEEALESIAQSQRPQMTRERVRQIEAKYKGLITDIYTESWLTSTVRNALAKQENQNQLPANEELDKCHPKMQLALRKVFLPESLRRGSLAGQERHDLAKIFELDNTIELINSKQWTLEKVLHEIKEFAREISKPDLMPMLIETRDRGRNDLNGAIYRFGGRAKVANLAGLIYQGQAVAEDGSRTYWTEERIGDFLRDVAAKEGRPGTMPSQKECRDHAPNPNTIITIISRHGEGRSWFEIANHFGLKYARGDNKVTLRFVRAFVQSLGDALASLTPSEIYVLFEQQGINKSGKNANRERQFDNLVAAM